MENLYIFSTFHSSLAQELICTLNFKGVESEKKGRVSSKTIWSWGLVSGGWRWKRGVSNYLFYFLFLWLLVCSGFLSLIESFWSCTCSSKIIFSFFANLGFSNLLELAYVFSNDFEMNPCL